MPVKLDMDYLDRLLSYAVKNKCEDVIIGNGEPVCVMWADEIHRLPGRELYYSEIADLLGSILRDPNAALTVARAEPIDFNYTMSVGRDKRVRFRSVATGCLVGSEKGLELAIRPVGKPIPTLAELGVEQYIIDNFRPHSGIVLVNGPTGSGKTTLLDSMMREILCSYPAKRVLTYYSPIENDLRDIPNRIGLVTQSEIGKPGYGAHLKSYAEAVRNLLRRHPHILVFGEARDVDTIDGAVMASVSGHTTYSTTHTSSVHMTIPRMVDAYPPSERIRVTNALIENSRLFVHQRLLPTKDGLGRVAVRSALAFTHDIRDELLRTPIEKLTVTIKDATEQCGISLLASTQKQFDLGNINESSLIALERELKSGLAA
jgi:Dot/Icm secretion system ATPase DotB